MHDWFAPTIVFEIKAADIQISPKYTCGIGLVHNEKGVGLRFPRFKNLRVDKDPADATPSDFVSIYTADRLDSRDLQPAGCHCQQYGLQ